VRRAAALAALFAALWWALAGGGTSWVLGVPLVALVSWLAGRDTAVIWRIRPVAALRFVPWFLGRAVVGGVDVLRRAVTPSLPIAPGFVTVPMRLDAEAAVLVTAIVSLSPGTLTAELRPGEALLHVIDMGTDVAPQVRDAERQVARLLGLPAPGVAA
jgi:multicomponent Na+:H+ antiporter subunit E